MDAYYSWRGEGYVVKVKNKRSSLEVIDKVLPYVLVVICVASARFIESELIVFPIYIASLIVYVWRRYDAQIFVGAAIFSLLTCAILLIGGCEKTADRAAVWAYYFLVVGIIGLFVDYLRGGENDKEENSRVKSAF